MFLLVLILISQSNAIQHTLFWGNISNTSLNIRPPDNVTIICNNSSFLMGNCSDAQMVQCTDSMVFNDTVTLMDVDCQTRIYIKYKITSCS